MDQCPELGSSTSEAQAWHLAGAPRPCQPHGQLHGEFLAFWEVWGLLPAFSRCFVGAVPHVDVFLMYFWGGRWSPRLTPLPSWRSLQRMVFLVTSWICFFSHFRSTCACKELSGSSLSRNLVIGRGILSPLTSSQGTWEWSWGRELRRQSPSWRARGPLLLLYGNRNCACIWDNRAILFLKKNNLKTAVSFFSIRQLAI